jgi:hypothetical protein
MYRLLCVCLLGCAALLEGSLRVPQSSLLEPKHKWLERDEVAMMRQLIGNTTQQLEMQQQLLQWMHDFQEQKEAFSNGNESKAHMRAMVRTARRIFESLSDHQLQHLFSQEYLDELCFFSSIAGKRKIK